jgi:hypothetical protein
VKQTAVPLLFALLALPAVPRGEPAAAFEASSGERQVALVELYTSEGCSSCPPADRWLSTLARDDRLWHDFAPLALHVDYWNDLGWTDRFARSAYSDRQRRYADESEKPVVYTPGVFVNGREWFDWRAGETPARGNEAAGELRLRVLDREIDIRYRSQSPLPAGLVVHVGLLGMNLETEVRAGENRGRRLRHDFVLLELDRRPLAVEPDRRTATARLPFAATQTPPGAIVAWVSTERRQMPLQAVGGFLPAD